MEQARPSNNPSGRPKGVPNKATTEFRQRILKHLEETEEQFKDDWNKLQPVERVHYREKLLKYVVPTMQSIALETEFDKLSDEQLDTIIERLKNQHNES